MDKNSISSQIGQAGEIGEADILVGIPSYNNARTIGHVVRAVQAGLAKYFRNSKALLVNSDGGSTDGTQEIVRSTTVDDFGTIFITRKAEPFFKIVTPYQGIPGKGSAFRAIFEIAETIKAKACAVVDSDLRSITPEWVELLIKPILEGGFDYVAPLYQRHKYDGTITNSIVYPLTSALYGKRIRQPIGGDFGFSGRLAGFYLAKDVWETDVARFGIDIWMTTTAVANSFPVCQSYLGAKIHDAKDPGADLSAMLYQVVSATFDLMETYSDAWKPVRSSEPVPTLGFQYDVGLEPVSVNLERMIDRFSLGIKELGIFWKEFMTKELYSFFTKLTGNKKKTFRIPDEIWVETVYSFILAAHKRIMNREHLLKSLTPLYIGRTASFVMETWDSDSGKVEEKVENLRLMFEEKKDFLIKRWDE
ncbi:MAG: glycosyltransferase [Syntrophorhabdaceae bacterium]|nr:glycosyltransferase [Syntrophorhabdaceae bacterium]